jgi:hypothetical protein
MKIHTRNLLIGIGSYLGAFVICFVISIAAGILYFDNPDTEMIYILTLLLASLFSFACYFVFYIRQRTIADKSQYAAFLGLGKRLIGGLIAIIVTTIVFFVAGLLDYLVFNGDDSLLTMWIDYMIIFLSVFIITNFVCFIVLKPRP